MNRRTFLAALGGVATQQKLGLTPADDPVLGVCEEPPIITVSRFPYVQNVRQERASILWSTFQSGFGQVRYTSDGTNFQFATATRQFFSRFETGLPLDYYQHQADITGLKPNTDYVYGVTVDGQELASAGETRFRTAAVGPGQFKFVVVGDSGWGDAPQGRIAQMIKDEKPALVIHTGDLTYPATSYDYYQRHYFNFYASMMCSVPFFACPGNHDYLAPNATPYLSIHSFPSEGVPAADVGRYYSFDWGNVHFVSIDSFQALERAINAGGPMLRWLENDLRTTRQFWRVVFLHYPAYSTGPNVNDPQSAWVRTYLVPIFESNGVQLVLSGHEHSYQRTVPIRKSSTVAAGVGTNYFVSGGGGAIRYPAPLIPLIAVARSAYHYLRVEVQGTRIGIRSIQDDGVELDNYTITPTPAFSDDPKVVPLTLRPGPVPGATIRILGRNLAAEESFFCGTFPQTEMAGTEVTVNGVPVHLLYVSPTQIYAQLPFAVQGNITVRVRTANGFMERSI